MKKIIFILTVILSVTFLQSCSKKDSNEPDAPQVDNAPKREVTFNVSTFQQTTEPMGNAPRKAPQANILDDEGGTALTDMYIFDGTTQLIHQTNDDPQFGTVTLELTHGTHNLSVIMTRSTGITTSEGVMTMASIRPIFGKTLALNVNNHTGTQSIELNRISGYFSITINDAFPSNANQIEFVMSTKYTQIDVTTLLGINPSAWNQKVSCTDKVNQTEVNYKFNIICPSLTQEYTSDVTINIYNSSNQVIYSVTIQDVRFAANTKTLLSGDLFTASGANITVNYEWNESIVGSF